VDRLRLLVGSVSYPVGAAPDTILRRLPRAALRKSKKPWNIQGFSFCRGLEPRARFRPVIIVPAQAEQLSHGQKFDFSFTRKAKTRLPFSVAFHDGHRRGGPAGCPPAGRAAALAAGRVGPKQLPSGRADHLIVAWFFQSPFLIWGAPPRPGVCLLPAPARGLRAIPDPAGQPARLRGPVVRPSRWAPLARLRDRRAPRLSRLRPPLPGRRSPLL
jgi:hypothetical protein